MKNRGIFDFWLVLFMHAGASYALQLIHYPDTAKVPDVNMTLAAERGLIVDLPFGPILGSCRYSTWNTADTPEQKRSRKSRRKEGCDVRSFMGLPYAEPPVGKRRFLAPEPWTENWWDALPSENKSTIERNKRGSQNQGNSSVDIRALTPLKTWSAVRESTTDHRITLLDARYFKVSCWSGPSILYSDEDCLHLNVFAPPSDRVKAYLRKNPKGLPVMFWIYGGGFSYGDSNLILYNPTNVVAKRDILWVTFNYRTTIFGFYGNSNSSASYNAGYLDSRMALSYVKKMIHHFHGDPDRITVMGLSSGATVTSYLVTDVNAPLFHKAIIVSNPFTLGPRSRQLNEWLGDLMAKRAGCLDGSLNHTSPEIGGQTLACMQNQSIKSLMGIAAKNMEGWFLAGKDGKIVSNALFWGPGLDDKVITGRPLDLVKNPSPQLRERLSKISLILSSTRDEMGFFLQPTAFNELIPNGPFFNLRMRNNTSTWKFLFDEFIDYFRKNDHNNLQKDHDARVYTEAVMHVFGNGTRTPEVDRILTMYPPTPSGRKNFQSFQNLTTSYAFTCSLKRFAEWTRPYVPHLYVYQFEHMSNWLAPLMGRNRSLITVDFVPHAADLPFLFQLPSLRNPQDRRVSDFLLDYLLRFMTDDDSNIVRPPLSNLSTIVWPEYQTGQEANFRLTGNFLNDTPAEIVQGLRTDECNLWNQLKNTRLSADADFGFNF